MSARERKERFFRAANEGRQAFLNGDSRESCPYKKSMWGMGYAWDMGYSEAMNEHEAKPDNNCPPSERSASE